MPLTEKRNIDPDWSVHIIINTLYKRIFVSVHLCECVAYCAEMALFGQNMLSAWTHPYNTKNVAGPKMIKSCYSFWCCSVPLLGITQWISSVEHMHHIWCAKIWNVTTFMKMMPVLTVCIHLWRFFFALGVWLYILTLVSDNATYIAGVHYMPWFSMSTRTNDLIQLFPQNKHKNPST